MAEADAAAVQRLWSARFGGTTATQKKWIKAALSPSRSATGLVAEAPSADPVVGFSFLEVGDRAYTTDYLSLDALELPPSLPERIGIFHLSCVHPNWEGQGIGAAFYERRLALLAQRDVPRAAGLAWHRPHTADSRVLFERHGFTRLATVERYYDRFEDRLNCPDCPEECMCTASLYTRSV